MIIFAAGMPGDDRTDTYKMKARIKAKADLWAFINEISQNIAEWDGEKHELADEISRTAIRMLHPHYAATELQHEIINILHTFKVEKPENFLSLHTDDVTKMMLAKMKEMTKEQK